MCVYSFRFSYFQLSLLYHLLLPGFAMTLQLRYIMVSVIKGSSTARYTVVVSFSLVGFHAIYILFDFEETFKTITTPLYHTISYYSIEIIYIYIYTHM